MSLLVHTCNQPQSQKWAAIAVVCSDTIGSDSVHFGDEIGFYIALLTSFWRRRDCRIGKVYRVVNWQWNKWWDTTSESKRGDVLNYWRVGQTTSRMRFFLSTNQPLGIGMMERSLSLSSLNWDHCRTTILTLTNCESKQIPFCMMGRINKRDVEGNVELARS